MGSRVVVIDDNPIVLDLLSLFLEEEGYRVAVAPGGREGLEAIRTHLPALVILDINMPDVDGIEVIRTALEDGLSPAPTFLVITAEPAHKPVALATGADVCLMKPFEPEELLALMRAQIDFQPAENAA